MPNGYIHPDIHDNGLLELKNNGDRLVVLGAFPSNYTELTTFKLAESALAVGDFTIANGDVSGRKITRGAKSPTATASGFAVAFGVGDSTGLRLMQVRRYGVGEVSGTDIAAAATGNKFTSTTTDLSVFTAGKEIRVAGFTDPADNGVFQVVSSTATEVVVSGGTLVTEAAGAAITIEEGQTVTNGNGLNIPAADYESRDPA